MEKLKIVSVGRESRSRLLELTAQKGMLGDKRYFDHVFFRQEQGSLQIYVALLEEERGNHQDVGYVLLNWAPKYQFFKKLNIPELQDLNVSPSFRRRGFGEALVSYCEDIVRLQGRTFLGVGVGLDSSYGAAQRLYVRLGYIPDGFGVTYDRQPVEASRICPIDDLLSLMMIKSL